MFDVSLKKLLAGTGSSKAPFCLKARLHEKKKTERFEVRSSKNRGTGKTVYPLTLCEFDIGTDRAGEKKGGISTKKKASVYALESKVTEKWVWNRFLSVPFRKRTTGASGPFSERNG